MDKKQERSRKPACKDTFRKCNLQFSSVLGLLITAMLVASSDGKPTEEISKQLGAAASVANSKCSNSCHRMICKDIAENESVVDHINKALETLTCETLELEIQFTNFQQEELSNGWLASVNSNVAYLKLYKCPIKKINKEAFAGRPFEQLTYLMIHNAELEILRKDSFLGLESLTGFELQNLGTKKSIEVEEQALEGMPSLTTLAINKFILTPESLMKLTGDRGAFLLQLEIVDLRYNQIAELPEGSFMNTPRLVSLYLSQSQIKNIHQRTFWPTRGVKLLAIDGNNLRTLEDGTFGNIKFGQQMLFLGTNNWQCDCQLQWMKDYLNANNYVNEADPPLCNRFEKFEDVDFCPSGFKS